MYQKNIGMKTNKPLPIHSPIQSLHTSKPYRTSKDSFLVQLTGKVFRYFMLSILGVFIAYSVSLILGINNLLNMMFPIVWDILWRFALVVLVLWIVTSVTESIKG